jgi:glycosyltransferase involved in cell wall biosynthesis
MEALALGRPVIATSIAGIPELVQPGISGWLAPAGSADALADAMRLALQASPAELAQMGRAGAARVARDHDARVAARQLAALFHSTLDERSRGAPEPARRSALPESSKLTA